MRTAVIASLLLVFTFGCRAQVQPNPTVYSCPASNGTAYAPLNAASPAAGLSYQDAKPAAGQYCYIAQSVISSTGQVSLASNTAGPVALDGVKSTDLTWTAPTSGPAPTGYVISRAPAIATTLAPPGLGTPAVAEIHAPQLAPRGDVAEPIRLMAMARTTH